MSSSKGIGGPSFGSEYKDVSAISNSMGFLRLENSYSNLQKIFQKNQTSEASM